MKDDNGNVLIVVLIFFMMTITAISFVVNDIEIMGRAVTTNEKIADARVGMNYLVASLKNEISLGELQNGTIEYQEYSYSYTTLSSPESDLIEIMVDIDNAASSYSVRIILDKVANTVELYEILE